MDNGFPSQNQSHRENTLRIKNQNSDQCQGLLSTHEEVWRQQWRFAVCLGWNHQPGPGNRSYSQTIPPLRADVRAYHKPNSKKYRLLGSKKVRTKHSPDGKMLNPAGTLHPSGQCDPKVTWLVATKKTNAPSIPGATGDPIDLRGRGKTSTVTERLHWRTHCDCLRVTGWDKHSGIRAILKRSLNISVRHTSCPDHINARKKRKNKSVPTPEPKKATQSVPFRENKITRDRNQRGCMSVRWKGWRKLIAIDFVKARAQDWRSWIKSCFPKLSSATLDRGQPQTTTCPPGHPPSPQPPPAGGPCEPQRSSVRIVL